MGNWGYEAVFYQIYPLGFCGAPFENDGVQEHRILKVIDWADHIAELGCNAVCNVRFDSADIGGNAAGAKKKGSNMAVALVSGTAWRRHGA